MKTILASTTLLLAVITPSELTFSGEEIKELNEATFDAVYAKPELALFHNVVDGIKATKQIAILGRINGLTGKGSGGCSPTEDTNTITMSEKTWDPKTVSNNLPSCWTDLMNSFFIYGTNNGIKKGDLTKTDYWMFILERMTDAVIEEVFRIIWFSDTAAADVDASPAGVLTSGTDPAYFNKIDGLWKQIYAIVAADSDRKTTDLASKNAQASFALQEFNTTDTTNRVATNALLNMRFGADHRLRGSQGLLYVVTQSVADQLEREYIADNKVYETNYLENGVKTLKSGGITVIAFEFWDRIIREYYSNGTVYYLPHRALLLTKENTQVGTEEEGTFSEFDSLYDPVTKKNYLRTEYNIDAKVVLDYMIQAAY
jgi:hypothetical protein